MITMKQLYHLFLFLFFLESSRSFSIISELSQLQQSLQKLTPFLSSSTAPTNIKKVTEIAQQALKEQNPGLFDSLEQSIIVVVAKQLIDYILKEKVPGQNMPVRVAAILEVVQQVTEQYQDKSSFNYVFVTHDESFLNEELFTKAFQFAGYKKLTLAYMNNKFSDVQKLLNENSRLQEIFSLKQDDSDKVYVVTTKVYDYISSINNYKKNQLFLMFFQKGEGQFVPSKEEDLKKIVQPNAFSFQKQAYSINIFLPYAKEDFFVTLPGSFNEDQEKKDIKETINKLTGNREELITGVYKAFSPVTFFARVTQNELLVLLDLIKYTRANNKFLAFIGKSNFEKILQQTDADIKMRKQPTSDDFKDIIQLTDISDNFEETYARYEKYIG